MQGWLIALAVIAAVWVLTIAGLWLIGRKVAAVQLARAIPDLLSLARGLIADPRVPLGSKMLLGGAIVWLISPVDLVPEFIPVLGPLDDVIVVALVLRHLAKRSGPEVLQDHWRGDGRTLRAVLRFAGLPPSDDVPGGNDPSARP